MGSKVPVGKLAPYIGDLLVMMRRWAESGGHEVVEHSCMAMLAVAAKFMRDDGCTQAQFNALAQDAWRVAAPPGCPPSGRGGAGNSGTGAGHA